MRAFGRAGWWTIGAALVCAVVAATAGTAQDEAAPPERGLTVRVVDMSQVLRSSRQWRDSAEMRLRLMENMRRTLTKLGQHVQALRTDYENLPPDTEERSEKEKESREALDERERTGQEFDAQIARQNNEATREVFIKIRAAVKAYAEGNAIDIVLKKESLDLAAPQTLDQNLMLATAEVLYAAPALDISDAIIERLNAEYPGPIEVK